MTGKYSIQGGRIINIETDVPIDLEQEPVFILRAKDMHAVGTLLAYQKLCQVPGQKDDIGELVREFITFARVHPELMKEPGTSSKPPPVPATDTMKAHLDKPLTTVGEERTVPWRGPSPQATVGSPPRPQDKSQKGD